MSKTYNFDIFPTLSQICTSPPPKFWGHPKFDHTPMCTLLKLDYAKFGVSTLFFQKLWKKNLWGSARPPPLVKEGLTNDSIFAYKLSFFLYISYQIVLMLLVSNRDKRLFE